MDIRLYMRVLWRFKWLVTLGLVLAVMLAVLTVARIGFPPSLEYRQSEVWTSQTKLILTEPGFPWGRSIYPIQPTPAPDELDKPFVPKYADPGRFYGLAELYAQFANSDEVLAIAKRRGLGDSSFAAAPIPTSTGNGSLPLLAITSLASSAEGAVDAANLGSKALREYLSREQVSAAIPERQRVRVDVVSGAREATLAEGRRKTLPVIVFLSVMIAVFGLAFALENLRPRSSPAEDAPAERVLTQARRSA